MNQLTDLSQFQPAAPTANPVLASIATDPNVAPALKAALRSMRLSDSTREAIAKIVVLCETQQVSQSQLHALLETVCDLAFADGAEATLKTLQKAAA